MKFTLQELRNKCAIKLNDPYMNMGVQVLDAAINEAQDFIVDNTWCSFRRFATNVNKVEHTDDLDNRYDLKTVGNDLVIKLLTVLLDADNDSYPEKTLTFKSQAEMDKEFSGWRQESAGIPTKVTIDEHWLMLYPGSDIDITNGLHILTISYLDDLVNPGDICLLPARLQRYIPMYVYNSLQNKDGDNEILKTVLQKERKYEWILRTARRYTQKFAAVDFEP